VQLERLNRPVIDDHMRKLTVELILSGVIVSFLETILLYLMGVLKVGGDINLLLIGSLLTILELILVFIIEELLIKTKRKLKVKMKKR